MYRTLFPKAPLIKVDKNADAEDAVRIMSENDVRRVAVTDYGQIIGIFSTGDVTKLVQLAQLAQ